MRLGHLAPSRENRNALVPRLAIPQCVQSIAEGSGHTEKTDQTAVRAERTSHSR